VCNVSFIHDYGTLRDKMHVYIVSASLILLNYNIFFGHSIDIHFFNNYNYNKYKKCVLSAWKKSANTFCTTGRAKNEKLHFRNDKTVPLL
jgi:hypothetical protein